MVGEHAVGVEVEGSERVGAELVEHVPREEPAGAVSGIYNYLQNEMDK